MKLYIVGRVRMSENDPHSWEICGVFDTKAAAVGVCSTDQHFVIPMQMNEYIEPRTTGVGWYPALEPEAADA